MITNPFYVCYFSSFPLGMLYEYIFIDLLQIPITLHKETEINENGEEVMKCGFKIGGGIDQDFTKSPQGYTDNVR